MKPHLISALMAASAAFCHVASAGTLTVSVIDKEGKPVPNAVVLIAPTNKTAQPKTPLPTQATIAQEKMQFIPAVSVLPVDLKCRFQRALSVSQVEKLRNQFGLPGCL